MDGGGSDTHHVYRTVPTLCQHIEPPGPPRYAPPSMSESPVPSELDRQLNALHQRFTKAMEGRLGEMDPDRKERYAAVLSLLVTKLESPAKGLKEIGQEMMTDAMSFVLQEMQS